MYYLRRSFTLAICFAFCLLSASAANSPDKWTDQLLSLRQQARELQKVNDTRSAISTLQTNKTKAEVISMDVTGMDRVTLSVNGPKGSGWGHGVFGEAKLLMNDGSTIWLEDIEPVYSKAGWGTYRVGWNANGGAIELDDKEIDHALFLHADGIAIFDLPKGAKTLSALVGLEDASTQGKIVLGFEANSVPYFIDNSDKDFSEEAKFFRSLAGKNYYSWCSSTDANVTKKIVESLVAKLDDKSYFQQKGNSLTDAFSKEALELVYDLGQVLNIQDEMRRLNIDGYKRTLVKMSSQFPAQKAKYQNALAEAAKFEKEYKTLSKQIYSNNLSGITKINDFLSAKRSVLLSNPLIEGKEILAIQQKIGNARSAMGAQIGRNQNNWTVNAQIRRSGWDNAIVSLSNYKEKTEVKELFRPENGAPVKDVDLNWDSERMLFSSVGENNRWHVYERTADGKVKQLTSGKHDDIDQFDAAYLPDGRVMMCSTAGYVAVPCITGSSPTSDLFLLDPKTNTTRQLNFGQDCDWNPTILPNGKVAYLRWEYTDNSHYFTRILMSMNPDGTAKKEHYGSGSYFPNSLFDFQAVPGHSSQFVGIVSGHHGIARSGRMMIFDPAISRKEAEGVVQEIPGYGKTVEPTIKDQLVNGVWPQFLTPFPLNEDYFLVTGKLSPDALWGIYLVDKNDNMTLVHEAEGEAFTEPIVVEKRPVPPVIPDRVNLKESTSTVYISDIYEGQGLKGVPKGSVKKLRLYAYQYGYNGVGGHDVMGLESGWDVKRILGTVPVEEDGSAIFKIPANTPISMQPLDEHGYALQIMRSWMTGMPGEVVSCVGCHEPQNMVVPSKKTIASRLKPHEITEWYGSVRPFTYNNEVKPVIERKCVGCHNGSKADRPDFSSDENAGYHGFSKSYMAIHPFIRRPGCESDFHTLEPMDYYANTSELVQILKRGHHGVELDGEEWDRLITWIDMNIPYRGAYEAPEKNGFDQTRRRDELSLEYANVSLIGEDELKRANEARIKKGVEEFIRPTSKPAKMDEVSYKKWPLSTADAKALQAKYAKKTGKTKTIELSNGTKIELVRIPAGSFVIGNSNGYADQNEQVVKVKKPFWMATSEITNEMFRSEFPDHNSRVIDQQWKDHVFAGYPANKDEQPAIRLTWEQAVEFCQKISEATGMEVTLPTEAQWEWAARAGSDNSAYYGDVKSDFSTYENLADYTMVELAVVGVDPKPMKPNHRSFPYYNFVPRENKYDDNILIPSGTKQYKPNTWGLYDMLGNVSEWTASAYDSKGFSGEEATSGSDLVVAKGGSWRDRPKYATAASRDGYKPFQKVYNVGFRIVINE